MKLAALFLLWVTGCCAADQLHFNEHGKFKVVQFTDLHYGNNERENERSAAVQDAVLEAEKPDLVIITGDLVSGYEWDGQDMGWFERLWKKLVAPMIKHNVRWAIALGNHDVEADLTGTRIVELDQTHPLSLTQHGPKDIAGASNYYLPIYTYNSSDEDNIGQILWVFDSGNKGCLNVPGWGCVEYDQVAWYRNASRSLAYHARKRAIPALAFFHIPLYEHLDLWNVRGVYGDLAEGEGVCCSSVNTGLYSAMKEMGDVRGVYCGHDHDNDYIGDYHGIALGFGRKTGYGCYGPPFGWQHGARVLEITQHQFGAVTWLRLEDGSIERQQLNSVSMRKFTGCCSMAGHGRVAMGWLALLFASAFNLSVLGLVAIVVYAAIRTYKRRMSSWSPLEPYESDATSGDAPGDVPRTSPGVAARTHLLPRSMTPVPRQRRYQTDIA